MYNHFMNNLISISEARTNLPELVNKVSNNLSRIVITVSGQPKATLISAEELESLEETTEILSIPGAEKSIIEGRRQAGQGKGVSLSELR